jgi:hypothetical protein
VTGPVLAVGDPAVLGAALDALPEGTWVEVTTPEGDRHLVVRVPGGWHLPGDVTVASADVVEGRPSRVEILGDDGHLPPEVAIVEARLAFDRARVAQDWDAAETLTREMEDLDSVGWSEAGRLRDEIQAWLDLLGEDPGDSPQW